MNILYFLTPKSSVAYIYDDSTLRQLIEKLEHHRYTAIPVLSREGTYVGTVTEGDVLRAIKNDHNMNMKAAENTPVRDIKRRIDNTAVCANVTMEDLVIKALHQNFVPVTDDNGVFIGIVKRQDIIRYCYEKYKGSLEPLRKLS